MKKLVIIALLAGCSSNIPIDPVPGEPSCDVPEECVQVVIDDYCPVPDACPVPHDCGEPPAKPAKKPHTHTRGRGHQHHERDWDAIERGGNDPLGGLL